MLGFYKGLRIRLFTTVPASIIAMSGYETIKGWSTTEENSFS